MINYEMNTINDVINDSRNNDKNNPGYNEEPNLEEVYFENEENLDPALKDNLQEILYEDETIQLTREFLRIFKYYYPLKKEKVIPLNRIKKASIYKLTTFTGKYKFYGLSWDLSWFHLDKKRPQKEFGIKINAGSVISIVITPDNPRRVFDLLNDLLKK